MTSPKQKVISLLTLLISLTTFSQTTFNKTQSIALPLPSGNAPYNIASGFIDDDSYIDLVVSTTLGNTVFWLKNDGSGTFDLQSTIIGTLNSAGGVAISDLNDDGFNDVISTSYNDGKLVWFENDGLGNFGTEQIISDGIVGPSQVYVRKIDGNDTYDVCVSAYNGNEVIWFSNDGNGGFGLKNIIDNTIVNPGAFAMKDIDFDGDIDAVIANSVAFGTPNDCRVEVFYNDGTGSFTADTNPVSVNTKDYIFSVMAEDVDNDNSLDILVTDINGSPSWFKRTEIEPGTATYTETVLTTSIVNPACLDLRDLDNDGLDDFVLSSASAGAGNDIVWYKNNGSGGFDPEIVIDNTQSQAYTFTFADFENDGDLDIASVAYNNDRVNIFNNQRFTLSLEAIDLKSVTLYPNPSTHTLHFSNFNEINSLVIYDTSGKLVLNTTLNLNNSIDISSLQAGLYFLKINGSNIVYKFLKK